MKKEKKCSTYTPRRRNISLSNLFTLAITVIVLGTSLLSLWVFIKIYTGVMEQNAVTSSNQAVVQVKNTVTNYTEDMRSVMEMVKKHIQKEERMEEELQKILDVRSDVVSITLYDKEGNLIKNWSNGQKLKGKILRNLSYNSVNPNEQKAGMLSITKPHVESLYVNYYPWVVTISECMQNNQGEQIQIAMDIKFDNIANYVDDVGIGQHGYCYIGNKDSDIIYHPQQQLIYSGLKEEKKIALKDGSYTDSSVIYTVNSLDNCDWSIIGVCYVDEMITSKVRKVVNSMCLILLVVILGTFLAGQLFSRLFVEPTERLTAAMRGFEKNTGAFVFQPVGGTREIVALSDSFEHMVVRIQRLVEKVRQEEISLRKTELNALQAQINPHFLYNTLDAIAWLCEAERNQDAEEMVTALAKLFRISISKGHELIPIEREVEHARSYLKIQDFRYKNQFIYSFDVDEECLTYLCNKITLQPIIENAIYHGLNRMVDEGEIRIVIKQEGEDIVFTVEDNGVGMTEEQCLEILHKEANDRTGIGIKNVNDRIKIYFGEQYGLTITSELDVGTCVSIRMPKVTEKNYEEK